MSLVTLCLAAYARLWANDFIDMDDELYLTANPHVYTGLTAENAAWAWSTFHEGFWMPLVWLSFQLDAGVSHALGAASGLNAAVYHGQNLFWHCAAVVLLFLALARMTVRIGPSAVVAALFVRRLAHALESAGRIEEAAAAYANAVAMAPSWPAANREAARKLLTAPSLAPGDAATALELSGENCQAAATPSAADLDLQAAALVALGRYDEAVAAARQALKAALPEEAGPIRAHLAEYEKRTPSARP